MQRRGRDDTDLASRAGGGERSGEGGRTTTRISNRSVETPWQVLPDWARTVAAWALFSLILGLATAALLWIVAELQVIFVPLLCALLGVALVRTPFHRMLVRGVSPGLAALVSSGLLFLVVGASSVVLGNALLSTWTDIQTAVIDGAVQLDDALPMTTVTPPVDTGPRDSIVAGGIRDLFASANRSIAEVSRGIVDGVSLAVQVAAGSLLTLTLVFHLLKDGHNWWGGALQTVDRRQMGALRQVGPLAFTALAAYIRGSTLIALIDASVVFVALLALGVPHAAGLAALVFFGAFVPYAGAIVSGSIVVLSALSTTGTGTALALTGVIVLVQALDSTVLQPWMHSRSVHLHPVVVLLALTTGASLAGIVGTLISVPIAALAQMFWEQTRPWRTTPQGRRTKTGAG